jgi:hypothetical protein
MDDLMTGAENGALRGRDSSRKIEMEAVTYPDEPHVFHFMPWKDSVVRLCKDNLRFLTRHVPSCEA